MNKLLSEQNSNVHRGVYYLSAQMTEMYESARKRAQDYLIKTNYTPQEIVDKIKSYLKN